MKLLYSFFMFSIINFVFESVQLGPDYSVYTDGWTDNHHETNTHFTEICVVLDILHSVIYSMEQSPSREANMLSVVNKFPAKYGIRRFITAVTSARYLSLS